MDDTFTFTESLLDKRIMRRLATDRAYLNAENAEEQKEREEKIEHEEWERLHFGQTFKPRRT